MCPSTEAADAQGQFAAEVLHNLLRHIEVENNSGHGPYIVTHAWTEGSTMYLVYTDPPSDRTWGLVRDTRESIIDPGPWPDLAEAVLYYYLCDFEENQPSSSSRRPGEPETIWWFGSPRERLPERPSEIPEAYRYTSPTATSASELGSEQDRPGINEPRMYGNRP